MEEGQLGYQIQGEPERLLEPGQSVRFEAGTPHRFWAAGRKVLHCTGYVTPPDNVQYFLSQVYRAQREANQDGRPGDMDAAFLLGRYAGEYDMPEIPGFVKRVVFPLLRTVGKLNGHHRRFDDAPRPLER